MRRWLPNTDGSVRIGYFDSPENSCRSARILVPTLSPGHRVRDLVKANSISANHVIPVLAFSGAVQCRAANTCQTLTRHQPYRLTVLDLDDGKLKYLRALQKKFSAVGTYEVSENELVRMCFDAIEAWKDQLLSGIIDGNDIVDTVRSFRDYGSGNTLGVHVASTHAARLYATEGRKKQLPLRIRPQIIIIDECHHAASEGDLAGVEIRPQVAT